MCSGVAVTAWPKSCRRAMVAFVASLRLTAGIQLWAPCIFPMPRPFPLGPLLLPKNYTSTSLYGALGDGETFHGMVLLSGRGLRYSAAGGGGCSGGTASRGSLPGFRSRSGPEVMLQGQSGRATGGMLQRKRPRIFPRPLVSDGCCQRLYASSSSIGVPTVSMMTVWHSTSNHS